VLRTSLKLPTLSAARSLRSSLGALTVLALVIALAPLVASRPAGADQVGSLRARAKQIAAELIQEQLEVGAFEQQYSVDTERVNRDEAAIASTRAQIQADARGIAVRLRDVRRVAVMSYVLNGSVSSDSGPALFANNVETVKSEDVYATVSEGDLTEAVAQLRTAQRALQADETTLDAQEASDRSEQQREAGALQTADTTAQQLSGLQSQVTGQLGAAVSQAQAAAEATAQSAVLSAEVHSVDLTPGSVDPALPPFLICVRQVESGGNYAAVSPNGVYRGAFQFDQPTWNGAAQAANRPDLVNVLPNEASRADQDTLAITLYSLDGERPWLGDRCSSS